MVGCFLVRFIVASSFFVRIAPRCRLGMSNKVLIIDQRPSECSSFYRIFIYSIKENLEFIAQYIKVWHFLVSYW